MDEDIELNESQEKVLKQMEDVFNDPDADGIKILSAFLALPDEQFQILRPIVQDIMIKAYEEPQTQMILVNLFAQAGVSIDDIINNTDLIADALFSDNTQIELSEPKKDFIKFLFSAIANSISSSTINPAHVVEIPVVLCRENAKLPTYSTNGSAAMDVYSPMEVELNPGECKIIPIGIKVAIPHGYGLLIQPRSGLSSRIKLRIPNSPGLIDEDYHEEIGVIVENIDPKIKEIGLELKDGEILDGTLFGSSITIGKDERFAQMRLIEVPRVRWRQVESFGGFEEDHGAGFGSTGEK